MFHRILGFVSRHQRRFARLILVAGAVYGALVLWPSWPREIEVEFALGAGHSEVVELRVAYEKDDQALHGVTFSFPKGAPASVRHRLTLPSGTFVVRCELLDREGDAREVTRSLNAPAEGRVRIPLGLPPPGAQLGAKDGQRTRVGA